MSREEAINIIKSECYVLCVLPKDNQISIDKYKAGMEVEE